MQNWTVQAKVAVEKMNSLNSPLIQNQNVKTWNGRIFKVASWFGAEPPN